MALGTATSVHPTPGLDLNNGSRHLIQMFVVPAGWVTVISMVYLWFKDATRSSDESEILSVLAFMTSPSHTLNQSLCPPDNCQHLIQDVKKYDFRNMALNGSHITGLHNVFSHPSYGFCLYTETFIYLGFFCAMERSAGQASESMRWRI